MKNNICKLKSNNGFTLSEVLITLFVVGIIAAMTIPNIIAHFTERATVVKLKKTYSILNSAVKSAVAINGPVDSWEFENASARGANSIVFVNNIKPYLNIAKDCKLNSGCWNPDIVKWLNGSLQEGSYDVNTNYAKFVLSNGTLVRLSISEPACNRNAAPSETNNLLNTACGFLHVDIDGLSGKNTLGEDIFGFYITKNGDIVPLGIKGNNDGTWGWIGQCRKNSSGHSCAAWVLYKENMNYLRGETMSHW